MIYALFMIVGYWMILTGNTLSGWIMFTISLGFDFLLSGLLYAKYVTDIGLDSFKGVMIGIFTLFLFVWIVGKIISFLLLQQRVRME